MNGRNHPGFPAPAGEDSRTFHDGMTTLVEGGGGMDRITANAY